MSFPPSLQRVTSALEHAGITYMLTGSFASAYYGFPRSTQDIDLVIAATLAQLRTFMESLPKSQYYADLDAAIEAHKNESMFNLVDMQTGWKIDLIIRKSRAFSKEEFERRQLMKLGDLPLFVASAEDVVLAKLEWAQRAQSQRQIEDAAGILKLRWESLDHVYLEKWVEQLGVAREWKEARSRAMDIPGLR